MADRGHACWGVRPRALETECQLEDLASVHEFLQSGLRGSRREAVEMAGKSQYQFHVAQHVNTVAASPNGRLKGRQAYYVVYIRHGLA